MEVIPCGSLTVIRFENPFKRSNTYLIRTADSNSGFLFDIGDSDELEQLTDRLEIQGLFITHAHLDHIKGIERFCRKHRECTVYGSWQCMEWLGDDRRNLSFYYDEPLRFVPDKSLVVNDLDVIALNDCFSVEAFSTPGHAEDCITYRVGNIVITGDSYIPFVRPVTKLKGGNKEQYKESLERIMNMMTRSTLVLPGHGPVYKGSELI